MPDEVTRLRNALQAQREEGRRHRSRAQSAEAQLRELLPRLEALEARSEPAPLAPILAGLATIRSDLAASIATMRSELDELRATVDSYIRQP